ncbi:hypothetical protein D1AOALGA4SA_11834 [Olavius algarvensis Delta 1 endosymbiont]|nr:hypothetical protein D1AOALGA4SA_11834 [Olavius algarvensis Delta 1 endosymbiont]
MPDPLTLMAEQPFRSITIHPDVKTPVKTQTVEIMKSLIFMKSPYYY